VGAVPSDSADLTQRANAAFAAGDFAGALAHYERAEERTPDPGLIAFNKGATLYRLGRWREAQLCYLRCLEDQQAPPPRRARALYDLGNSLMRAGADEKSAATLELAIKFYRICLTDPAGKELQGQARHNLELARLLWNEVRAGKPPEDPGQGEGSNPPEKKEEKDGDKSSDNGGEPEEGKQSGQLKTALEQALQSKQKARELEEQLAGKGNLRTLPDNDQLAPLDSNDAAALLSW